MHLFQARSSVGGEADKHVSSPNACLDDQLPTHAERKGHDDAGTTLMPTRKASSHSILATATRREQEQ